MNKHILIVLVSLALVLWATSITSHPPVMHDPCLDPPSGFVSCK